MSPKILFVDDEPNVTGALKHMLGKEQYDILTANSADEALTILGQETVDVVVSDEQMPGMSGSQLLAHVRREYPDSVRIILTGQASLDAAVHAINEGEIYRFLTKPCNSMELAVTIRQALQQKKLIAESRKLLKMTQRKSDLINDMEVAHPGSTEIKRDASGTIIIDDPTENIDELIQEINTEVKKSEKLFLDWTVAEKVQE